VLSTHRLLRTLVAWKAGWHRVFIETPRVQYTCTHACCVYRLRSRTLEKSRKSADPPEWQSQGGPNRGEGQQSDREFQAGLTRR
jgi:hypothetical protein